MTISEFARKLHNFLTADNISQQERVVAKNFAPYEDQWREIKRTQAFQNLLKLLTFLMKSDSELQPDDFPDPAEITDGLILLDKIIFSKRGIWQQLRPGIKALYDVPEHIFVDGASRNLKAKFTDFLLALPGKIDYLYIHLNKVIDSDLRRLQAKAGGMALPEVTVQELVPSVNDAVNTAVEKMHKEYQSQVTNLAFADGVDRSPLSYEDDGPIKRTVKPIYLLLTEKQQALSAKYTQRRALQTRVRQLESIQSRVMFDSVAREVDPLELARANFYTDIHELRQAGLEGPCDEYIRNIHVWALHCVQLMTDSMNGIMGDLEDDANLLARYTRQIKTSERYAGAITEALAHIRKVVSENIPDSFFSEINEAMTILQANNDRFTKIVMDVDKLAKLEKIHHELKQIVERQLLHYDAERYQAQVDNLLREFDGIKVAHLDLLPPLVQQRVTRVRDDVILFRVQLSEQQEDFQTRRNEREREEIMRYLDAMMGSSTSLNPYTLPQFVNEQDYSRLSDAQIRGLIGVVGIVQQQINRWGDLVGESDSDQIAEQRQKIIQIQTALTSIEENFRQYAARYTIKLEEITSQISRMKAPDSPRRAEQFGLLVHKMNELFVDLARLQHVELPARFLNKKFIQDRVYEIFSKGFDGFEISEPLADEAVEPWIVMKTLFATSVFHHFCGGENSRLQQALHNALIAGRGSHYIGELRKLMESGQANYECLLRWNVEGGTNTPADRLHRDLSHLHNNRQDLMANMITLLQAIDFKLSQQDIGTQAKKNLKRNHKELKALMITFARDLIQEQHLVASLKIDKWVDADPQSKKLMKAEDRRIMQLELARLKGMGTDELIKLLSTYRHMDLQVDLPPRLEAAPANTFQSLVQFMNREKVEEVEEDRRSHASDETASSVESLLFTEQREELEAAQAVREGQNLVDVEPRAEVPQPSRSSPSPRLQSVE